MKKGWLLVVFLLILGVGCAALDKETFYREPERLNQRIAQEKLIPPLGNKYTVLISGQTEERHEKNLSLAYQVLLESGFLKDNIYILDYEGDKTAYYPVDDHANPVSVRAVLAHLQARISSEDLLLIYITDHGDKERRVVRTGKLKERRNVSVFGLQEENMDEIELAFYVEQIKPKIGIYIFVQCYGGGFADRLAGSGRITIAANAKDKMCDGFSFSQPFFNAFRDRGADINGDGRISIQEAFEYALKNGGRHKPFGRQEPFIRNGIGYEVFLDD